MASPVLSYRDEIESEPVAGGVVAGFITALPLSAVLWLVLYVLVSWIW